MDRRKVLYWIPRGILIFYIFFLALFALDVFSGNEQPINKIMVFLIHLSPNYVLLAVLLVSWRHELIGGIILLIVSIGFTVFFKTYENPMSFIFLTIPLLVTGVIFVFSSKQTYLKKS